MSETKSTKGPVTNERASANSSPSGIQSKASIKCDFYERFLEMVIKEHSRYIQYLETNNVSSDGAIRPRNDSRIGTYKMIMEAYRRSLEAYRELKDLNEEYPSFEED